MPTCLSIAYRDEVSVCKVCKDCLGLSIAVHAAAETRFYGAHIVAERMLEVKAALQQTVVSQEWTDWVTGASVKVRDEAADVKALVLDEKNVWGKLVVMVDIFQPIVKLLRLTDSAVPAASKVSALCMQAPAWLCSCCNTLCKAVGLHTVSR